MLSTYTPSSVDEAAVAIGAHYPHPLYSYYAPFGLNGLHAAAAYAQPPHTALSQQPLPPATSTAAQFVRGESERQLNSQTHRRASSGFGFNENSPPPPPPPLHSVPSLTTLGGFGGDFRAAAAFPHLIAAANGDISSRYVQPQPTALDLGGGGVTAPSTTRPADDGDFYATSRMRSMTRVGRGGGAISMPQLRADDSPPREMQCLWLIGNGTRVCGRQFTKQNDFVEHIRRVENCRTQ